MDTKTKLVVILLIIAIIFSIGSVVLNLSLLNFKPVANFQQQYRPSGNLNGNLQLFIESNGGEG